jgi:mediator of RNA polymerase II transcription subunit 10
MRSEITSLIRNLSLLQATAPHIPVVIPPEIISYVERARNPDIYTREMMENLQRGNQALKGKSEAFAELRDVLAREIVGAIPELEGEVGRVVEATGGRVGG